MLTSWGIPIRAARPSALIACALYLTFAITSVGCRSSAVNPSFNISRAEAQHAIKAIESHPRPFDRPLVVLGGYLDPALGSIAMAGSFRHLAGGQKVIGVSFVFDLTFDQCRRDVVAAVESACPCSEESETAEVDVVALSMGGIVARYCAIEKPGEKRLHIRRLYTVSAPHLGSACASVIPPLTFLHHDLREGSSFLTALEVAEGCDRGYEIVPYVRLGDWIVGTHQAAPEGQTPWWISTPFWEEPHLGAPLDPRIIADIALRLRGEESFTHDPPATLP